MPPQIFKNRVIATAGPLPGQLSAENVKRWTENRRGRFSEEIDEYVTHVLCTRRQYRKKVPGIRQALGLLQMGRKIHIVHCDWFEESTVHNRKLPEHEYSMRKREAERRAAEREAKRLERGIANGEKFVNTNHYHIYRDREFFPYQIDLIKYHEETGKPSYKWTLCLWESNAKPHLHWFTAKLLDKNPGKSNKPLYHKGSAHAVKWRVAFDQFQEMFEKLCKIQWEDRVSRKGTVPRAYQYVPPVGGKPVGRRLKHHLEYCLEINASLLGLPWPPIKPSEQQQLITSDDADEVLAENGIYDDDKLEEAAEADHDDEDRIQEAGADEDMDDASEPTEASADGPEEDDAAVGDVDDEEPKDKVAPLQMEDESASDMVTTPSDKELSSASNSGVDLAAFVVMEESE